MPCIGLGLVLIRRIRPVSDLAWFWYGECALYQICPGSDTANPPCTLGYTYHKNTIMFLPKIQESHSKNIIMKLIYYKEKTKIRFYHNNLDPTCKYHCKTTLFYKTYRINDSSVRSCCIGWFEDILEEEAGFNKKPVNIRILFYQTSGFG